MDESATESEDRSEDVEYIVDRAASRTYLRGCFLGQGAHAMVYLVTDYTENPNKEYAMKIMTVDESDGRNRITPQRGRNREVKLRQILKEVEIHKMMRHKNVVRLVAHFQNESKFYMVLEHCEMNNLAQLLRTYKKIGENESRNFLKQLLAGLQHIHDQGIIHRDLKPANIYVTCGLILKIGDFGLADRIASKSKGICGTPNYISPEVLNEQGYTTAVDIWALGCITYQMITGRPPFEADNQPATYNLIRTHRYSQISPSQAGAALQQLINWMLAYHPEDRPSIPQIHGHTWMKRGRRQGVTWLRPSKIQTNANRVVPLADSEDLQHSSLQVTTEPTEKRGSKRESPLWRIILERAKSHTKLMSSEDSLSVFGRLKKAGRWSRNGFKSKEIVKKMIEEVLRGFPVKEGRHESVLLEELLPVFVSKWIDYSNKYGFGYELTDGTCGVIFNDNTHITVDSTKTYITWWSKGRKSKYPIVSIPNQLLDKAELLNYFVDYMDCNLSSGIGNVQRQEEDSESVVLVQWARTDKVILFEMSDGSIQINFFQDHSKFIIFEENNKDEKNTILLTIDKVKNLKRYNLSEMGRNGCPEDIINNLIYIHSLL